ncbi:1-(5-phosphoribosyl)-5-[(5-phosphoribosylamino)methylideneamino] imidazole-4-carboxamide isomerase [Marinomonas spartinae]|uniref:1-(5-phosphoribosyl)-5-[(5-phosphoribosylamino)methylideneamino] imidazole-4-carboxamide isomerase n=1 Tax=Marinomonas spartinae TaxID=1792290 RepID=A0A1A8TPJ4_9GAMM|nr:phosphoribosylformimino-5-aminoimidazole carboxamide ribotide isomerase [Marinomonas spartinae]SBS35254.1 1-(5-phosphoribosyl)-5-[(5-phosphoribosylamino)methylideneamino] imidazole-4-carboxamide isomerase [Marinomonas spartinae]
MTQFRPCIDLHQGKVKQIVGGSLNDKGAKENFISEYNAAYYASLYREHGLTGGHVIALGKGNHEEALSALRTYPGGLQFGGGVTARNAAGYLEAGASHVIVTSYLFKDKEFSWDRLDKIKRETGVDRLVLDLSCRRTEDGWYIATDRWQTITSMPVTHESLTELADHCDEFLIHAADVEGLQAGIDEELVSLLGQGCPVAVTYAGGARSLEDLKRVNDLSNGIVDLTIGSALDIFGGQGVTLDDCILWNQAQSA